MAAPGNQVLSGCFAAVSNCWSIPSTCHISPGKQDPRLRGARHNPVVSARAGVLSRWHNPVLPARSDRVFGDEEKLITRSAGLAR